MLSDERATKSLRLCMSKPRHLVFFHRIRILATECGSKEQAALLTTACANSSWIQRFVTNTAASKGVCIDGPDVVVDAILCAEHARLEIRDVKVAARRFSRSGGASRGEKRWSSGSLACSPWTFSTWPLLLDGEWLELRFCPINDINRDVYERVHPTRWLGYMRTTIELLGLPRTSERAAAYEALHLDRSGGSAVVLCVVLGCSLDLTRFGTVEKKRFFREVFESTVVARLEARARACTFWLGKSSLRH